VSKRGAAFTPLHLTIRNVPGISCVALQRTSKRRERRAPGVGNLQLMIACSSEKVSFVFEAE